MIITRPLRRVAAAVLSAAAVLATSAATLPESAPVAAAPVARAAAPACPVYDDKLKAAADPRVDLDRITPEPVWRTTCGTLYRSDGRGPDTVFEQGFQPKDVVNGQYDIAKYVDVNQPSPYVSTSYDHDLYKTWYKSGWNYYIDAPGGIDVNRTIGDTHRWAEQAEVAFPGGIDRRYVVGVCPVDRKTKTEIMDECRNNPYYEPWH
ncbi:ADP-ribosyltransferase [Streptomyces sp. CRN 30]|uniref:ADP-ribosyltransferase n=1 Tax=Streptomyces sp. CRN 30 TaxID=3075613 RepID=UPI002A82889F|nr:ADP-ribosyltransferase [Streptomyces sp. CRN 30]